MYGTIKVDIGTNNERELKISDYLQVQYIGNRVTIGEIEDGTITAAIEIDINNKPELSTLILTRETFIEFISTTMVYFDMKGEDVLKEVIEKYRGIDSKYSYSDNLDKNK